MASAYVKDPFYSANKDKILKLASDPKALKKFPTKTNPVVTTTTEVIVKFPKPAVRFNSSRLMTLIPLKMSAASSPQSLPLQFWKSPSRKG